MKKRSSRRSRERNSALGQVLLKVVLHRSGIVAIIRELQPYSIANHVGMNREDELGGLASVSDALLSGGIRHRTFCSDTIT